MGRQISVKFNIGMTGGFKSLTNNVCAIMGHRPKETFMKKILCLFAVLLFAAGCGGSSEGDNTELGNKQDLAPPVIAPLDELSGCAGNILQMDEEFTACSESGELPGGKVRSNPLSQARVSFYPDGTFEQSDDGCNLRGKYVFTSTGCSCVTYSVLQDTVYCGVSGENNETLCDQCFMETDGSNS